MGLIRLLLALSVVIVHSSQQRLWGFELVGGQGAVQAFYVISGFYMALVLNRKYPPGLDGYRTFILARLFRLFPAYTFVLLLTIALAATNLVYHPAITRWRNDASSMTVPALALYGGSQLTLIGQDAVWFTEYDGPSGKAQFVAQPAHAEPGGDGSVEPSGPNVEPGIRRPGMDYLFVAQAWTLGVELLFYCVAPFIVRRVPLIVVFFIASWAIRLTLAKYGLRESPWSYRFFPSELAMFLMGSAGYHLYAKLEPRQDLMRRVGSIALPVMVLIVLFWFMISWHGKPLPLRSLFVACMTAISIPFIFALTKRNGLDRWIGELSYPVYITHELVRLALIHHRGAADTLTMVVLTLVFSVIVMVCIEQPIERARARFIERRAAKVKPLAS